LVFHGILSGQYDDTARAAVESAHSNLQAMENAVRGAQEALARAQVLADSSSFARRSTALSQHATSRLAV
jgi:hypothetical protein